MINQETYQLNTECTRKDELIFVVEGVKGKAWRAPLYSYCDFISIQNVGISVIRYTSSCRDAPLLHDLPSCSVLRSSSLPLGPTRTPVPRLLDPQWLGTTPSHHPPPTPIRSLVLKQILQLCNGWSSRWIEFLMMNVYDQRFINENSRCRPTLISNTY